MRPVLEQGQFPGFPPNNRILAILKSIPMFRTIPGPDELGLAGLLVRVEAEEESPTRPNVSSMASAGP